jgi:8-oxo-dGTP diphosphatase
MEVQMKKNIHVVGAVIIKGDKVLCAQRGANQSLALKWEFPGGKIEAGESPQQALAREIHEEMQCSINIGKQTEYTVHEYEFGVVHLTTFYCTLVEGTPVLTEHAAIKWLPYHELASLDWAPADIPAIRTIMNDHGIVINELII